MLTIMAKCPKCQSENVESDIDWLRDMEEEVRTYFCNDCKHEWLGGFV